MSHITKIKTSIVDQKHLLEALHDMGFNAEIGNFEIKDSSDRKYHVDIKICLPFSNEIGFRKSDEKFELVADWFGVIGIKKEKFLNTLHQRYAYHVTRSMLEEKGFTLIEEVNEKDEIHLILRRVI